MLELRILVDDIDYDSIAEYLIPAVAEKLRREEKGGILGNVLAGNPDMAASMARTVLGAMSQEQKDQLLVQLVTKTAKSCWIREIRPPAAGASACSCATWRCGSSEKTAQYRQSSRPGGRLFFFACNRREFLI